VNCGLDLLAIRRQHGCERVCPTPFRQRPSFQSHHLQSQQVNAGSGSPEGISRDISEFPLAVSQHQNSKKEKSPQLLSGLRASLKDWIQELVSSIKSLFDTRWISHYLYALLG
jgi:hypothetical protein